MGTQILDYSRPDRWRIRQLPWRRLTLAVLALYFSLFAVLRLTGAITHSWGVPWGKVSDPNLAAHNWEFKFERGQALFIPAIALEAALRDLGPAKTGP